MATKEKKAQVKSTNAEKALTDTSIKTVKKSGISVVSFNVKGEKGAEISLSEAIFGQKDNKQILAQAVNVYLGNQRSASAKTKTRAEINRTTAKVYKQKGTGGARHGSRRAPIYVGGGIAHGPSGMQNYDRTMSKTLRSRALAVALSSKVRSGQLFVADLDKIEPKTKNIVQALKKMSIIGKTLIVSAGDVLNKSARNIENIIVVRAQELTAYQVLQGKNIIITTDALKVVEGRFSKNA